MKITVPLVDGHLADQFGSRAPQTDQVANHPVRSFPVTFTGFPKTTKTLALTLVDYDSIPVCGFAWIHWTLANLPATTPVLPEDASRQLAAQFIQGKNSNASRFVTAPAEICQGYTGPRPPHGVHDYLLTGYALNTFLSLPQGYWMNELLHAMEGHVLDTARIPLPYSAD
ncbi:YbhB/YbcL family Raf kinase inhibitor-like protein [Ligilactobacillus sp. LYQ60]|uniref:YbhB/YbcL family Raf kinase inhibitor-like protein n=1 Tax=unclassified Ligilactobacillus TaxID=2767920 RepID=UPI0038539AE3